MNRNRLSTWIACFAPLALAACERVHVTPHAASDPVRIVAASAGALDWIAWAGFADRIVAIPQQAARYSNGLTDGMRDPGVVPRFANFRAEPLLAFRPTLVVCDGYQNALTIGALERAGVVVCKLRPLQRFSDLEDNVAKLSSALGFDREAKLRELHAQRDELRARGLVANASVLPYYELGGVMSSAGRGTSESVLLDLAGVRNHAAFLGLEGHGSVPVEKLLTQQPDWVLASEGPQLAALRARRSLQSLVALERNRVLTLPSRLRQANSPYVLEAARSLRAQLDRASAK